MAKRRRVHDGPPPETWLWDARPLENESWGNVRGFDDDLAAGDFIDMRLWLCPEPRPLMNEPPIYRPAHAPLPPLYGDGGVRRCYRPTEDDLAIVQRVYPEHRNHAAPPWLRIEADVIAIGRSRDEVLSMNAPTLLRLLPAAMGKKAGKRGRRPDTDAKADAKIAQAMASGQYPTYQDLANEMGLTEGDVRRAVDRHRQRQKRRVK